MATGESSQRKNEAKGRGYRGRNRGERAGWERQSEGGIQTSDADIKKRFETVGVKSRLQIRSGYKCPHHWLGNKNSSK